MTTLALQRIHLVGLTLAITTVCGLAVSPPADAQTRAAVVRDIDNPALQPFRFVNACSGTTAAVVNCQVATVPAGKRLVIEFVGFYANAGSQDRLTKLRLRATTQLSTFEGSLGIAVKPSDYVIQTGGGAYEVAFNQVVKLYFEPGETIEANAFYENVASTPKNLNISVQGHYVNIP